MTPDSRNFLGFTFLTRCYPVSSHLSNPYTLVSVPDVQNQSEFWLFSSHGVLYSNGDESEFLALSEWAEEHDLFQKVHQIPYFKLFRLRKYFAAWRVRSKKLSFKKRRKSIGLNLIYTEIELAQPILSEASLLCELEAMNILPGDLKFRNSLIFFYY